MRKFFTVFCNLVLLIQLGHTQDFHWSLYHLNPTYLNPAFTGFAQKKNRISGLYRDQLRSIPVPYSTFNVAYDRNVYEHQPTAIQLGIGGQLLYDKSGDGALSTYRPAISFAVGKGFNDKKQVLSLGVNFAYVRQQINFSKLSFDNQYNGGNFNPDLPSGERLTGDQAGYFDLGLGINFNSKLKSRGDIDVGISLFNINSPKYGFLSGADASVLPRTTVYTKANINLGSSNWAFHPGIFYQNQNKAQETLLQSIVGVKLGKKNEDGNKEIELQFGPGYRINDAVVAYLGLDWKDLKVGFAFDGNVSGLKTASQRRGAYELAINYIWEKKKKKEPEEFEPTSSDTIPEKEKIQEDTTSKYEIPDSLSLPINPNIDPIEVSKKTILIDSIINHLKSMDNIQLFFANDIPNKKSRDTTTSSNYKELFDTYIEELELIKNGENPERFIHQVEISMVKMDLLLKDILLILKEGKKVEIELNGFASPLSNSSYNLNLSKRRIASVINFLNSWNHSELSKYIESGQLLFTPNAYGDTQAKENISTNKQDKANSIYSTEASYERRIEVRVKRDEG